MLPFHKILANTALCLAAVGLSAFLSSCVCQVQTSKAIRLHGQECTGVIIPGLSNNKEEYYRANGVYYVKGIQTRLRRANCELAYYQWPEMGERSTASYPGLRNAPYTCRLRKTASANR